MIGKSVLKLLQVKLFAEAVLLNVNPYDQLVAHFHDLVHIALAIHLLQECFLIGFQCIAAAVEILGAEQNRCNNGIDPVNAEPRSAAFIGLIVVSLKRVVAIFIILLSFFR